jgi:ABC-2 type transport system ATP-binding protein
MHMRYDTYMATAISAKHLAVKLEDKQVLRDISVTIPEGKVVGLLGPSGAGKTTLLRTFVGLQRPSGGQVKVLGLVAGAPALRSKVGYVTQAPSVYSDLTVGENLNYFATMIGTNHRNVLQVIEDVRLGDQVHQLVKSLSGGQRARVSLAVALLGQPELLILDEPTVGLDPVLREELWEQFHRLARSGVTLVVSSHVMDEARRCDGLILVRDGNVLAEGTPTALMAQTGTLEMESAFLRLVEQHA